MEGTCVDCKVEERGRSTIAQKGRVEGKGHRDIGVGELRIAKREWGREGVAYQSFAPPRVVPARFGLFCPPVPTFANIILTYKHSNLNYVFIVHILDQNFASTFCTAQTLYFNMNH